MIGLDCHRIEENVKKAEEEVRHREEVAFILQKNELECSRLSFIQQNEIKYKKDAFKKLIGARQERKMAKRTQRQMVNLHSF